MSHTRAIGLNCIDGRVQIPVIDWIKEKYRVDHVDMITEPGMDGLLGDKDHSLTDLYRKIQISIDANNASVLVAIGHYDCKGNPCSDEHHQECVRTAVTRLQSDFPQLTVTGLWINSDFQGEEVAL